MREKSTLTFLAFGKHHTLVLGREKAAELAYYAYLASMGVPEGQHGTGELKGNYRHGDAKDEFRTWPVEHFTITGRFDRMCDTFGPAETFCDNACLIRKERTCEVWKCLGHQTDDMSQPMHPFRVQYPDETEGVLRSRLGESVLWLQKAVEESQLSRTATTTVPAPEASSSSTGPAVAGGRTVILYMGVVDDVYYPLPKRGHFVQDEDGDASSTVSRKLMNKVLTCHWTSYRGESLTGFTIVKESTQEVLKKDVVTYLLYWRCEPGTIALQ